MKLDLLQLRYFQTVARYESVSSAARDHGIPQAAMSQTLRRLERDLGDVRLFDRINNRIYLNEAGRFFLEHVNVALAELDTAVQGLKESIEVVSGPLRMLILENNRFLTTCVSRFLDQYPNVNFYISHTIDSDTTVEYDLCISSHRSYQQMTACAPLISEPIILAVHESHPLANRESVRLEELRDERFISMTEHTAVYEVTREKCRLCGFEPNVVISCDDPYYVRKYISQNMGIALAPALSWKGRFRENTRLIPIETPTITTTSYLLWNEHRYQSSAARAFRSFLKKEAAVLEGNLLSGTK